MTGAVPLLAGHDVIGLLGVFPARGRMLTENESALLSALAVQLAVAVQNAQLHERAKQLGEERPCAGRIGIVTCGTFSFRIS